MTPVFALRRRGHRTPYRTFGYPVTPILFIALSGWIAYARVEAHLAESLVVLVVLAVGGVLYRVCGARGGGRRVRCRTRCLEARIVGDPQGR